MDDIFHQDQVSGTADRKPFGETFYDTEYDDLQKFNKLLIFTPMLYILNIACGLLVFIVMKTRSFGHPPYVNRFKKMLLQASLRRIFPNPLTHARLLVGVFDLPVDRLQAVFF